MPRPAITACLMVSLLLMARPILGRMPAVSNNCSIRPRVPDPGSRVRKVSPASSLGAMRDFRARRCAGRRDDDMGMIADQVNVHVDVCRRAAHDRKVEIIAAQRRADLLPVSDRERDVDVRVQLRKSGNHERHEIFRGRDGADRDAARGLSRHHLQRGFAIRDRRLDPVGEREHFAPGIGQQHAVAGALDQRQSGERLQIAKLQRDRGLREMELFGRCGDRPVFLNRGQRAQLADRQFPQQPARHCRHLYKKNFAWTKDNKILLIRQIAFP